VVLPPQLALKVVAGALFLLCLPVVLQLLPEASPLAGRRTTGERAGLEQAGFAAVRVLLWVPQCGLFASVFFPPGSDDRIGLLRFGAAMLGAAVVAVALSLLIRRRPAVARLLYLRVALPLALLAVLLAAAVAMFT
jgi:hypothetical protein